MEKKNKLKEYLSKTKNPYKLEIDGITVEIEYSKNNKTFEECILNILKQKNN